MVSQTPDTLFDEGAVYSYPRREPDDQAMLQESSCVYAVSVPLPESSSELDEWEVGSGQAPEGTKGLNRLEFSAPSPSALPEIGVQDDVPWFDALSAIDPDETQDDLLGEIPSMHRLLDLVYETGSAGQGGLVEKIIIDHDSLGSLLNRALPGSYRSISSIDFKSLDNITVKPKGVYGTRPEIANFLASINAIDNDLAQLLAQPEEEPMPRSSNCMLRSGLYELFPSDELGAGKDSNSQNIYIIYWPEDTTWNDDAIQSVQRNRIVFMRLSLLSEREREAELFVWDSGTRNTEAPSLDAEEEEDDARMFTFEVKKSEDQEENVTASQGFKVELDAKLTSGKQVKLIGGENAVGVLFSSSEETKATKERKTNLYTALALKNTLLKYRVILGKDLDDDARSILMDNGLKDKYPHLFDHYDSEIRKATEHRDREIEDETQLIRTQLERERASRKRVHSPEVFGRIESDGSDGSNWPSPGALPNTLDQISIRLCVITQCLFHSYFDFMDGLYGGRLSLVRMSRFVHIFTIPSNVSTGAR
ncbi:unnamed protein product [Rhizoctonia solani]|uniref:Uncharacterized protein n=1 Tax=Rhizoctonia solani TaxID=456999 RepID=A0A8H2XFM6_9AGAM|nr:unnamed protein product [Rhizoctonia solani]